MDLATGAMGSLLLKLGKLLMEEYKLQTNVKEDVEYLKRELTSMYAALRKVGGMPRDQLDDQLKLWANEVRDLSFIMEDIVDKFLVRVEGAEPAIKPRKLKKLMKKMGNLFRKNKTHHEISDEIKDIKGRVKEAAERRDRYWVNDVVVNPVGSINVDPRLLALYKDQKELIGIDDSLNELTKMMCDGDGDACKQLKILSIFGFGGLGKTTLAKAVYDKLKPQFGCCAFVPVGRNPSLKKLLNDILFGIHKKKYTELDERELIDKLRELLENKRYLIVIDDIWDKRTWKLVKTALLKPLSLDLSKDLFHRRLSCGEIEWSNHLPAEVYNKILHKCGGVPLAIITIASLLVGKPVEVWSKVYTSIGFGHEENEDVENTRKILLFSYYDLPCYLKTCLLYLSIYPEDHLIDKDSLIWKWVAEGFIHEEPGIGLFEIGERYFNELVNKSMIMPVEIPHHGIITGCRVHDIMLDMICLLSKEENFVTVLDSNEKYTTSHCNAHRLAVDRRVQPLASISTSRVRSLNAMCGAEMLPSFSCFEVLRVLALEGPTNSCNPNYLEHVGKLVHLRHLKLASMGICEVPKEIGYLKFLVVLDLGRNSISELPESISRLSQLKCLNICETDIEVPCWIGNLTSLEELCLYKVDEQSNFVTEVGKLTELRKLRISNTLELWRDSERNAWEESVGKLNKIQVIDINHIGSFRIPGDESPWGRYALSPQLRVLRMAYGEPGLVARINPRLLPNLSHLELFVYTSELDVFGRFQELVTLKLCTWSALHHDTMGGAGAFPKLRVFKTEATIGSFLEGDMPILESLQFRVVAQSNDDGISFDFDFDSLRNLPLLQSVRVFLFAHPPEHKKAEEMVRRAIDMLPNRPSPRIHSYDIIINRR
ncbi:disease resistance protein RGA5-like [Triticum aestivum]|uniref:disease resistance protein RGA5-like n=1 Tax=Triticum aestivum TaxID=4565 RepID=UPI001D010784|nr:disease resistance protein RGA5-like [Triticum aestivum]